MNDRRSRDGGDAADSGQSGPPIALIVGLVVAVLALIFVLSNTDNVRVEFLGLDGEIKTWLLIVVSAVVGAVLDRTLGWWWRRRRRRG